MTVTHQSVLYVPLPIVILLLLLLLLLLLHYDKIFLRQSYLGRPSTWPLR